MQKQIVAAFYLWYSLGLRVDSARWRPIRRAKIRKKAGCGYLRVRAGAQYADRYVLSTTPPWKRVAEC